MLILSTFLVCIISGIMTGLLGIGGGLIIIPMFLIILPLFNITTFSIHQIIGISATCVFFNSLSTIFYRRKEKFLPSETLYKIAIFVITGTILGSYFSSISSKYIIFSIYLIISIASIYFIKSEIFIDFEKKTIKPLFYAIFCFIGLISSMIGIGGAVFFATTLKCFFKKNTKELLPTITLIVLIHAFFAFLSKMMLKEVTYEIIPIAIVSSLIGAKIGVLISKKLTAKTINNLMIFMLILSIIKVTFEFFY